MRISPNWLLLILYSLLLLMGLLNHELWLDEMHHWLLARESRSLAELYEYSRYEGHPILWNVLLYVLTRFTDNPFAMQLLHGILAISAAALLIFTAPFPFYLKVFLVFGYYNFYEYAVISRNYVLILLFVLLACWLYSRYPKTKYALFVLLLLLVNTHLLAIPVFIGFLIFFFWKKWKRQDYILAGIALFFLALSLYQINPPSNHPFQNYWTRLDISVAKIGRTFNYFGQGLFPLSDFSDYSFWNKNLFNSFSGAVLAVLSIAIFGCFFVNTFPHRRLFFASASTFIGVYLILYFLQMIGFRYYGIMWICMTAAFWLLYRDFWLIRYPIFLHSLFILVAFLQMIAGVSSYMFDVVRPFSQAQNVVEYIQENKLESIPLAVTTANAAPSISGYLRKPVYHLDIEQYQSFCLWYKPVQNPDRKKLLDHLVHFASKSEKVLLASNHFINKEDLAYLDGTLDIRLIKSFQSSIIKSEAYWLYFVQKN